MGKINSIFYHLKTIQKCFEVIFFAPAEARGNSWATYILSFEMIESYQPN